MATRPSVSLATSLFAVTIAATSTACRQSGSNNFRSHGDTAYVGVAVGLQDPDRYVNVYKGAQLALDQLNASRPNGAPILALKHAPDSAKANAQVASAFLEDPSVIGVVGHTESDATISAAAVYDDHEHGGEHALVAVSPTAAAGDVTRSSTWVFRVCPVVSQQAVVLARYFTDSLHLKRIAIVYRNDVSGREFLRTFAATLDKAGATLTERDPFAEEIAEFDLYAKRLAASKPDGLMIFANSSDVLKLLRAVHGNGFRPPALSTNGPSSADLAADAGKDLAGLRHLALFLPDRPLNATGTQFVNTFKAKIGQSPDHWAALSYDAAMLIGRAAQEVGPDRAKIRDWIAATGNGRASFAGASGDIRFDADRNPIDKSALVAAVAR